MKYKNNTIIKLQYHPRTNEFIVVTPMSADLSICSYVGWTEAPAEFRQLWLNSKKNPLIEKGQVCNISANFFGLPLKD